MKFEPIRDKVITIPEDIDSGYSNVITPDLTNENLIQAKVIAHGPGMVTISGEQIDPQIEVGDTVLYYKMNSQNFEYNKETYHVVREGEIITILDK